MIRHLPLVAVALAVAACAGLLPGTAALPTDPQWSGGCSIGVGLDAVLHGAPSDPRVAWATDRLSGVRVDLVWPNGYSARFPAGLEILDSTGAVVAREGDLVIGTCMGTPPRVDAGEIRPPTWQPGDG